MRNSVLAFLTGGKTFRRGYSIVELAVVLAVIGVIIGISVSIAKLAGRFLRHASMSLKSEEVFSRLKQATSLEELLELSEGRGVSLVLSRASVKFGNFCGISEAAVLENKDSFFQTAGGVGLYYYVLSTKEGKREKVTLKEGKFLTYVLSVPKGSFVKAVNLFAVQTNCPQKNQALPFQVLTPSEHVAGSTVAEYRVFCRECRLLVSSPSGLRELEVKGEEKVSVRLLPGLNAVTFSSGNWKFTDYVFYACRPGSNLKRNPKIATVEKMGNGYYSFKLNLRPNCSVFLDFGDGNYLYQPKIGFVSEIRYRYPYGGTFRYNLFARCGGGAWSWKAGKASRKGNLKPKISVFRHSSGKSVELKVRVSDDNFKEALITLNGRVLTKTGRPWFSGRFLRTPGFCNIMKVTAWDEIGAADSRIFRVGCELETGDNADKAKG